MAFYILLLLIVVLTTAAISLPYHSEPAISQFKEFVKTHDKNYENEIEEAFRFGVFLKSLDFIDHLNRHSDNATFGITQFADRIDKEIHRDTESIPSDLGMDCQVISDSADINVTHTEFDWRSKGVLTPAKNQGQCGSSWAMSIIGNVEAVHAIKTGKLVELSPQQLVDCDLTSFGCSGGWRINSLVYLKNRGSMSESSYPYVGKEQTCRYDDSKVSVRIKDCYILKLDEPYYAKYLQQMGPLSIVIDGSILKFYKGGIVSAGNCIGFDFNLVVLLVGYGEEGGMPYWIVKNSWGPNWGEQGYFRMQRHIYCLRLAWRPSVTAAM